MKKVLFLFFVLCCFAYSKAQTIDTNAVDGQLLVKITNPSSEVFADFNGDTSTLHNDLVPFWSKYGLTKISRPFAVYTAAPWTQKTYLFEFSNIDSVQFFITDLMALAYIEDADKVYYYRLAFVPNDSESALSTFNNKNWHLKKVNAEYGWDIASTNSVRVAVIDNEMDLNHPDLTGRFILASDQADTDANTVGPTTLSHGTHVAGLVGANTHNATGVASIAGRNTNLKIIPIKVAPDLTVNYNSLSNVAIIQAVMYADANGANIISMSLGGFSNLSLENAIATAVGNGRLFVCAAGNSNTTDSTLAFPAAYNQNPAYANNIICVGSTNEEDHKSVFSNYGAWVDVMGPGSNIYSTDNTEISPIAGGYYTYKSGTSMATPMVASLCAYIYGIDNTLTAAQIKNIVLSTARDVYPVNPTYTGQLGTGVIDMYAAGLIADNSFIANFSASAASVCPGSDISLNAFAGPGVTVTAWNWNFSSAVTYVSGSSSSQNIIISVATPTVLSATLTATTTTGTVTIVKPDYINISRPEANIISMASGRVCSGSPQNFILNFTSGVPPFEYTISNVYTTFTDTSNTSTAIYYAVADPNYPVYTLTSVTDATGCTATNVGRDTTQIVECCQNLVTNGDFENGNTGFSSDNIYSCTTTSQGYYGVNTYPTNICASFPAYVGTMLSGNSTNYHKHMSLAYDGPTHSTQATAPGGKNTPFLTPMYNNTTFQNVVWEQSTPVITAGHNYNLDYFTHQNYTNASEVHLETRILDSLNNVLFDTIKVMQGIYGGYWEQNSYLFNNPSYTGWVIVQIRQVRNFHSAQYDIALDDISLRRNNASDAAAFAGVDTAICYGQSVTLSGSGGPSYLWSPSAGLTATNVAMPIATPTTTTTYVLEVTNGGCATTFDSVKVTVSGGPVMTLSPASTTICPGWGVLLSTTGGTSPYQWYANGNLMPFNQSAQYVAPTVTTVYTVENVLANGCKSWATATVTVNTPTVTVAPTSASICQGGPGVVLTASGATTYTWVSPIGLSASTGSVVTANPPSTRTYTVTGTQAGCMDTAVVTVTVNPLPTITITPTTPTVCIGSSITLTGGGASTYTWSPNAGGVNTNTVSVSPTTNTTYTLYGQSAAGCQAQQIRTVTAYTVPIVGVSPTTYTMCSGNSVGLTGSGSTGGYTWTPSGSLSSPTGATVTATPPTTTTITVTGSNAAGCTAQATSTITINTTPTVSVTPTNTTYCVGTPLNVTASGATTYTWSPSAGLNTINGASVTATPSVTTTYTVTGTASGCNAPATSTITVAANTCFAATGKVPRDTVYSVVQTNFGTGLPINSSIAVMGNVTFTTGNNVIGCNDVRIAPGVKVTVASTATLTIAASYLHSCSTCGTGMWDGIYVENGGKLVIGAGSRIEDAVDAVSVQGYVAAAPIPDIQITQTIFNRNTSGVTIALGTQNTTNYQPSLTNNIIDNCVFTCRNIGSTGLVTVTNVATAQANFAVIKDSVYNNVYSLSTTNAGVRSLRGIRIHRVGSPTYPFIIGEAGTTNSHGTGKVNLFDNLDLGISAGDSYFAVKNCQFQYSKGNSTAVIGVGIASLRDPSISVGCSQTGIAANEGCVFKDLLRGIHIGNNTKVVYIHKNTFNNSFTDTYTNFPTGNRTGQYGIYMQPVGGAGVVVNIDSNSISNCALGIHFLRNSTYTGTGIYINDNTITANGTTNAYCNKGVFMEDVTSCTTCMASESIEIKRNTITNIEEKVIHCSGVQSGLNIACNNELSLRYRATGGTMAGGATFDVIRLDNCRNSFNRFNNYIRTSSGNTQVANLALTGIYINNSTAAGNNNTIDANDIRYLGACMVFQGTNPTATLIQRNVMTSGRYGLYMNSGAAFNTQAAGTKNRWGTAASFVTTFQTYNANGANVNTMAKFNVYTGPGAGTGYTYAPTNHDFAVGSAVYTTGAAAGNGFITTSINPPSCLNCASTCGGNYNFPPIDCEGCEEEEGQMLASGGYNENQSMESENEVEGSGNEEMQRVLESLVHDTTVSLEYNSQRLWVNNKWAFEQIHHNSDLLTDNANLQAFYSTTINAPIGLLTQAEQYMENGLYTDANSMLNTVSPENNMEQYLADVYRLELNRLINTTYVYSGNEMNALYAIASECELASGPAVLKARALVNKISEGYVPFNHTCNTSAEARIARIEEGNTQPVSFNLYPNPTSGNLTVEFDAVKTGENAAISVYAMDGKLLVKSDLDVYSNTAQLSVKDLQNGVYIIKFSKNGVVLTNERLVIMK
ncbi:MAG: hypothetical protein K0S33_2160 [Bacteroidetes bacterium]|jgi:hypothetical protein|nr:hypothetical protein [Bacteroidota bacterium]